MPVWMLVDPNLSKASENEEFEQRLRLVNRCLVIATINTPDCPNSVHKPSTSKPILNHVA